MVRTLSITRTPNVRVYRQLLRHIKLPMVFSGRWDCIEK